MMKYGLLIEPCELHQSKVFQITEVNNLELEVTINKSWYWVRIAIDPNKSRQQSALLLMSPKASGLRLCGAKISKLSPRPTYVAKNTTLFVCHHMIRSSNHCFMNSKSSDHLIIVS